MHVYKFLYDGGTEKYMYTLMKGMDRTRYEFSVCCLLEKGKAAPKFESAGFPVHALRVQKKSGWIVKLLNLRELLRLAWLLRRTKTDVVHSHDNFPALYARIAAWLAGVSVVYVTYHNVYTWLSPMHHRVNRFLSYFTTRIVAVTSAVKKCSQAMDHIPDSKYRVIYNGLDCPEQKSKDIFRQRYRQEFGISDSTTVIGNVGTLSVRKGQKYLIAALGKLVALSVDAVVVIVGSERQEEPGIRAELEQIAERYNVSDRLIFTGSREDVLDILYMFDLFAMPSVTEGFGLALVESMCAGVPSIVSDIPAFLDVTNEGRYSLVCKSGNADSLAEKIQYARTHSEEMATMAADAKQFARTEYNTEKMLDAYQKMYAEDLQRANLPSGAGH